MRIELLTANDETSYDEFVKAHEGLLFASIKYKYILEEYLQDESIYLVAKNNDDIVGCLPLFVHTNLEYGSIINSLPYYGSNGGVLCNDITVKKELINEYLELLKSRECVSGTIISSPFDQFHEEYLKIIRPRFVDKRIGQITFFDGISATRIEDDLMGKLHYKTRNSIRKAIKSDVTVKIDNSDQGFEFLYKTHAENMRQIGGLKKEKRFFDIIRKKCEPEKEYDLFVAYKDGIRCSALLLLYYGDTVEYFTPVTVAEYRSSQPLSLIIFQAMYAAIEKGYKRWNWGGTWISQSGVYDFKRKWGTTDLMYYYYTSVLNDNVLLLSKEKVLSEYKNYYVFPFGG